MKPICDSGEIADQCRAMGLVVGDTIEGREDGRGGYWNETRLTLLWLGETEAVFSEQFRDSFTQEWSDPCESVDWTLDCREWHKLNNAVVSGQPPTKETK